MFVNQLPIWRELTLMKVAHQLTHINSDLCWCDPIVEIEKAAVTLWFIGKSPGTEFPAAMRSRSLTGTYEYVA